MAIINEVNEVLHRIRVKLYPNFLPKAEGTLIARTINEATLSVEEVCAARKNGAASPAVTTGSWSIRNSSWTKRPVGSATANAGGTFKKVMEGHDTEKHPVMFRFRTGALCVRL